MHVRCGSNRYPAGSSHVVFLPSSAYYLILFYFLPETWWGVRVPVLVFDFARTTMMIFILIIFMMTLRTILPQSVFPRPRTFFSKSSRSRCQSRASGFIFFRNPHLFIRKCAIFQIKSKMRDQEKIQRKIPEKMKRKIWNFLKWEVSRYKNGILRTIMETIPEPGRMRMNSTAGQMPFSAFAGFFFKRTVFRCCRWCTRVQ